MAKGKRKEPLKLPVLARERLRREIKAHPNVRQHVTNPARIDGQGKSELLELADKLGINVEKIVRETKNLPNGGLEAVLEQEEIETLIFSERHPGFVGHVEFDLTFALLGHRVQRRARLKFTHTPIWPYFDLTKKAPYTGWEGTHFFMEVLAAPGRGKRGKKLWTRIDILNDGVLP